MFMGLFVDARLLDNGVYYCDKPYLYPITESIESLIEKYQKTQQEFSMVNLVGPKYFENLRKCKLVEVTLTVNEK